MWWLSATAAAVALIVGGPDRAELAGDLSRIVPILVFLVGVTVTAELATKAGVFDAAAREAARLGCGHTWRLWLLVVVLGTSATIVLSLDTTAVLLTPVVLSMARQLGVSARLFAMTTVWLSATASLLLPVSNLTNLLATHRLRGFGAGLGDYLALTWRPALAAILVTVAVAAVMFRHELRGRYVVPAPPRIPDRPLFWGGTAVCLLLGPAFLSGVDVAWPAAAGALVLLVLFGVRRPAALGARLLPWRLVVTVTGLFTVVSVLDTHGLRDVLGGVAGAAPGAIPDGFSGQLRLAGTAAAGANLVDNLPAYLALEPLAGDSPGALVSLLIGVNFGCLLTFWGSLATLLWRDRCRAAGVRIGWAEFLGRGAILAPLVILTAVGARGAGG